MTDAALGEFWAQASTAVAGLPDQPPLAWAFGAEPDEADALLALVLAGVKTATSSWLRDYSVAGEPLPEAGDLSVVLDGAGIPRALLVTTEVTVTRFDQVDAAHAHAEGEGDRTLASWRRERERFWRAHSVDGRGFSAELPVVCERFRLLYPVTARS